MSASRDLDSFSLETPRLLLRPPHLDDLDAMAVVFADPEVVRFIGNGEPRPRERVEQSLTIGRSLWEQRGYGPFTVITKCDDAIIGDCILVPIARSGTDAIDYSTRGPEVEIGYRLSSASWGHGYATEAARAVLEWARAPEPDGAGLNEIIAVTYPENTASQNVLHKIGMHCTGTTERYYDCTTVHFTT